MYIIIVYDVNQKRVNKFCKFLRQYLHWIQNSVFEGEVSESQYLIIKERLKELIKGGDSVIIFKLEKKWLEREIIGKEKNPTSSII